MTCADKQVTCTITTPDGYSFVGTNQCMAPQVVCPRGPGEDYVKCRMICKQPGHAEMEALKKAGKYAWGASATIRGINWMCRDCQMAMVKAGIVSFQIIP